MIFIYKGRKIFWNCNLFGQGASKGQNKQIKQKSNNSKFRVMEQNLSMVQNIIALFIPIFGVLGLFTAISLNYYFKYKTNTTMSERVPLDTLGEWYKAESKAKSLRSRGLALRWGGFLSGAGLGVAIGCMVRISMLVKLAGNNIDWEIEPYAVFLIIALAVLCGGAGMIGAYFLEKRLDKKDKSE
jgi:hypothetical protein